MKKRRESVWAKTSTWEWLKPYVLRSTSLPIEDILQLRVVKTKDYFHQWQKATKVLNDWCSQWIEEIRTIPKQKILLSQQRRIIRRIKQKNPLTENDKTTLLNLHMEEKIQFYSLKNQELVQLEILTRNTFEQELGLVQQKLFELYQSERYDRALYTINSAFWSFYQSYKRKSIQSIVRKDKWEELFSPIFNVLPQKTIRWVNLAPLVMAF